MKEHVTYLSIILKGDLLIIGLLHAERFVLFTLRCIFFNLPIAHPFSIFIPEDS